LTLAQSGATCSRRDPPFLFCLFWLWGRGRHARAWPPSWPG
jgi:hypothetical protein